MDTLIDDNARKTPLLLLGFGLLSVLFVVGQVYSRLYNDKLSHIPGPKVNALSRIPYTRHLLKGTTVDNVVHLHKKYGGVVRISPNQVSFASADTAFPDIYGFRTGKLEGHLNMQKDPVWYPAPVNGAKSILLADDENHTRGRRLLSHAFSEKALAEQEPLVQRYVDQLVDGLKETNGKFTDVTAWYNWTTFDVIADLLFGEPFGCLQDKSNHQYIALLFKSMKAFRLYYIRTWYPIVNYLGSLVVDKALVAKRVEFMGWVHDKVDTRLKYDTQRPDFMTHIMAHQGEKGLTLSDAEIDSNASLILVAGSETTATLLSGATYLLLTNPKAHKKLKDEIRPLFNSYSDITLSAANSSTPYLLACLSEALRIFPPVPTGFERCVNKGGEYVSGYFIPEGTAVSVSHYPAYHSEENFKNAESFIPERWLDDPEYANDRRGACQPFSCGPRNCIGKNLAYTEMRLVMAKIIWTFDMELDPACTDWIHNCKVFTLWDKPDLNVRFKEVVR